MAKKQPEPTRPTDPKPVAPYTPAGGGFLGRTPFGGQMPAMVSESQFDPEYYLKQYKDVALDPYYGKNPFHHYQDYGYVERRNPFADYKYDMPSQMPMTNEAYKNMGGREDLINMAYQNILGRAADPAGMNYYSQKMNREGGTGQGLVSAFTSSPEFQRTQEFNRAYTEAFRPGYQEFGPSGQYYQPIQQQQYTNYAQSPGFYSPSYGGYSPSTYNPFYYGVTQESARAPVVGDQGIAEGRSK